MKLFFDTYFTSERLRTKASYKHLDFNVPFPNDVLWLEVDRLRADNTIAEWDQQIDGDSITVKEYAQYCVDKINSLPVQPWLTNAHVDFRTSPPDLNVYACDVTPHEIMALILTVMMDQDHKDQRFVDILQSQTNEVEDIPRALLDIARNPERGFNLEDIRFKIMGMGLALRTAKAMMMNIYGNDYRGLAFCTVVQSASTLRYVRQNRDFFSQGFHVPNNSKSWYFDYKMLNSPQNQDTQDFFEKYRSNNPNFMYANHLEFFYIRYVMLLEWINTHYGNITNAILNSALSGNLVMPQQNTSFYSTEKFNNWGPRVHFFQKFDSFGGIAPFDETGTSNFDPNSLTEGIFARLDTTQIDERPFTIRTALFENNTQDGWIKHWYLWEPSNLDYVKYPNDGFDQNLVRVCGIWIEIFIKPDVLYVEDTTGTNSVKLVGPDNNWDVLLGLHAKGNTTYALSGKNNTVDTNSTNSGIVGGANNYIGGTTSNSSILSGTNNSITNGAYNFIGAGQFNTNDSIYGSISSGRHNSNIGNYGFIGSGEYNTNNNDHGFIGTGINNIQNGLKGFIGAGRNNTQNGFYGSIVGGSYNQQNGENGFIGAGIYNVNNAINGFIGAGDTNSLSSSSFNNAIIAGVNNVNSGNYSIIVGGDSNTQSGSFGFIGSGANNSQSGGYSFIGAGSSNIQSGSHGFIGAGSTNIIHSGVDSFIGAGLLNHQTGFQSFLGAGTNNNIGSFSTFLGAGQNNTISGGSSSFVGSGENNLQLGSRGFIGAGRNNTQTGSDGFIGGGNANNNTQQYGVIVGGIGNIQNTGQASFIGAGTTNNVTGSWSFIGSGISNTASGDKTFVGAGQNNKMVAEASGSLTSLYAKGNNIYGHYHSSGRFNFTGDSQSERIVMKGTGGGGTTIELKNNGNNITVLNNSTYGFRAKIIGTNTINNVEAVLVDMHFLIKVDGLGVCSIIGTEEKNFHVKVPITYDVTPLLNPGNIVNELTILCTNPTGINIHRWSAEIQIINVGHA